MIHEGTGIIRITALLILVGVLAFKISSSLRRPATKAVLLEVFNRQIIRKLIRNRHVLLRDYATQQYIANRGRIRWWKHYLIFFGGAGLLIFHGLPRILFATTEEQIFPWAPPELRIASHWLFAAPLLLGGVLSVIRHIQLGDFKGTKRYYHLTPVLIIFLVSITGIFAFQLEYVPRLMGEVGIGSLMFLLHSLAVYAVVATLPLTKFAHIVVRLLPLIHRLEDEKTVSCIRCGIKFTSETVSKQHEAITREPLQLCPSCKRRVWIERSAKPINQ